MAWRSFNALRFSRDAAWLRRKAPGEKFVRYAAEVPPELDELLMAAQRKSMGVNWDGFKAHPKTATRANLVTSALRLYLNTVDPEPEPAIEGTASDILDVPLLPPAPETAPRDA